jgi:hypothetical protein
MSVGENNGDMNEFKDRYPLSVVSIILGIRYQVLSSCFYNGFCESVTQENDSLKLGALGYRKLK